MIYTKIELMQIEKSDIPEVKTLMNTMSKYTAEYKKISTEELSSYFESDTAEQNSYSFSIRGLKEGGFGLSIIGFCHVLNIDWVSKNAEISLIMHGDGSRNGTIPKNNIGTASLDKLLEFCFKELNLEKVYIEVVNGNDIIPVLDKMGFVAEGIRRKSKFKNGSFVDSTICAILAQEYRALVV